MSPFVSWPIRKKSRFWSFYRRLVKELYQAFLSPAAKKKKKERLIAGDDSRMRPFSLTSHWLRPERSASCSSVPYWVQCFTIAILATVMVKCNILYPEYLLSDNFGFYFHTAIFLGSLKLPHTEVKKLILNCDQVVLTESAINSLLKYLPSPEQVRQKQTNKIRWRTHKLFWSNVASSISGQNVNSPSQFPYISFSLCCENLLVHQENLT